MCSMTDPRQPVRLLCPGLCGLSDFIAAELRRCREDVIRQTRRDSGKLDKNGEPGLVRVRLVPSATWTSPPALVLIMPRLPRTLIHAWVQVIAQRLYLLCMEEGLFAQAGNCRGDQAGEHDERGYSKMLQGTYPCKSSKFYAGLNPPLLTSPHLTSPHFTSPHLTSHYLTSLALILDGTLALILGQGIAQTVKVT